MKLRIHLFAAIALAAGGAFGGCCHIIQPPPKPVGGLPAPISMEQQIAELNARAVALPRFKARAYDGDVQTIFPENGKPKTSPAGSGTLLLEQTYATHGAKLLLQVKYLGKMIFELGRNDQVWWAVQHSDQPGGWTGPAQHQRVADVDSDGKLGNEKLFELLSDVIPDLLAVTEIAPDSDETIVMKVDDLQGVNDLMIVRAGTGGTGTIQREIIVDRRSGEVQKVILYKPNGEILAMATLSDYRPVTFTDMTPPPGQPVPTMPRNIVLDYPAGQARLGMQLSVITVLSTFPADPFTPPDWQDEGISPHTGE